MAIAGIEYFTYRVTMDDADGMTELLSGDVLRDSRGVYEIVPVGGAPGTTFPVLGLFAPGLFEQLREGLFPQQVDAQHWHMPVLRARNVGGAGTPADVEIGIARTDLDTPTAITGPTGGITTIGPGDVKGLCFGQLLWAGDRLSVNTPPGDDQGPVILSITIGKVGDLNVVSPVCRVPA